MRTISRRTKRVKNALLTFCGTVASALLLRIGAQTVLFAGLSSETNYDSFIVLHRKCETLLYYLHTHGSSDVLVASGRTDVLPACVIIANGAAELFTFRNTINSTGGYISRGVELGRAAFNYCSNFRAFLSDVAIHLSKGVSRVGVVVCGDLYDLPPRAMHFFGRIGAVPLVHALRVQDGRCPKDVIPIPDPHFIQTRGFEKQIAELNQLVPFESKIKNVFWRGSTTGFHEGGCGSLERVMLAKAVRESKIYDVALTNLVQLCDNVDDREKLRDLLTSQVPERQWVERLGVLDIDGNVGAWGLFWRLGSGSVVFRVIGENIYCSMLSEHLTPWVHFVPVYVDFTSANVSTYLDKLAWDVMSNSTLVGELSQAASALAASHSYEREVVRTAAELQSMFEQG